MRARTHASVLYVRVTGFSTHLPFSTCKTNFFTIYGHKLSVWYRFIWEISCAALLQLRRAASTAPWDSNKPCPTAAPLLSFDVLVEFSVADTVLAVAFSICADFYVLCLQNCSCFVVIYNTCCTTCTPIQIPNANYFGTATKLMLTSHFLPNFWFYGSIKTWCGQ